MSKREIFTVNVGKGKTLQSDSSALWCGTNRETHFVELLIRNDREHYFKLCDKTAHEIENYVIHLPGNQFRLESINLNFVDWSYLEEVMKID